MVVGLLSILFSYGFCAILLHVLYHFSGKGKPVSLILVTRNNQTQIEWYLRYFQFLAWMKGRDIAITVVDEGSDDDTLEIVRRFSDDIVIARQPYHVFAQQGCQEAFIVIHINRHQDLAGVSIF